MARPLSRPVRDGSLPVGSGRLRPWAWGALGVWLVVAFLVGGRWVREPASLLGAVVTEPRAGPSLEGPEVRGRAVLLLSVADCVGRTGALSTWSREVAGDTLNVVGVVVDAELPGGSMETLRDRMTAFPLQRRGWQALVRAVRRMGHTTTPMALLFDGRGRLVRVIPADGFPAGTTGLLEPWEGP